MPSTWIKQPDAVCSYYYSSKEDVKRQHPHAHRFVPIYAIAFSNAPNSTMAFVLTMPVLMFNSFFELALIFSEKETVLSSPTDKPADPSPHDQGSRIFSWPGVIAACFIAVILIVLNVLGLMQLPFKKPRNGQSQDQAGNGTELWGHPQHVDPDTIGKAV